MYKIVFLATLALAAADNILPAPLVAAPAPFVTASSSQYVARNYNGLYSAPLVAPAPVIARAASLVAAPAPYYAPSAPLVAAPAPYYAPSATIVAAPSPYYTQSAPLLAAPSPYYSPAARIVAPQFAAPAPIVPAFLKK